MKTYSGTSIQMQTFRRGGYHILRISTYNPHLVATRNSRQPHVEEWWSDPCEKKFEQPGPANSYFKAIKRSHPDLRLISDEPSKYVNHEGKIKEY